jgi:hypothetical protein
MPRAARRVALTTSEKSLRRMPGALLTQRSSVPGRRRQRIPSRVTVSSRRFSVASSQTAGPRADGPEERRLTTDNGVTGLVAQLVRAHA